MTMLERLNNLTPKQRQQLQYAFENQIAQYVELSDHKFVGVGIAHLKHLKIEEAAGTWSFGTIVKSGVKNV
jgi:phage-related protein